MKRSKISVNEIQFYLSKGAHLHPLLYRTFLSDLYELQNKHKVCLIPISILQHYHIKKHKVA